jgi:hypothetical protein
MKYFVIVDLLGNETGFYAHSDGIGFFDSLSYQKIR